eukprot:9687916-Karenia_brevis.AAC.1
MVMMMMMGALTTPMMMMIMLMMMMMMMMTMVQKIENERASGIRFCAAVSRSCAACRRPGSVAAQ